MNLQNVICIIYTNYFFSNKLRKVALSDVRISNNTKSHFFGSFYMNHLKKSWHRTTQRTDSWDEWTYRSSLDIMAVPFIGQLTIYGGGGYIVELKPEETNIITNLLNYKWFDGRTKAVFIELTLYNVNVNLFSSIMMVVEYSITGGLLKSGEIFTTPLSSYRTSQDVTRIVFEFIFCFSTFFPYILNTRKSDRLV